MNIEAMKRAKAVMANARDWFGNDLIHRWDEDEVYHELVDAVVDLNKAIAEAEKQIEAQLKMANENQRIRAELKFKTIAEAEKQEPVVWMYQDKSTHEVLFQKHMRGFVDHSKTYETPLYTHPPKREWIELTRKEFAEILCDDRWQGRPELMLLQAQAKLKEKNT